MLLFLEGPDLAGKSTLARALSELSGMPVIKEHVVGKDVYEQTMRHLQFKDAIVDRCYFTEWIYSQERGMALTEEEMWSLGLLTESSGAVVLVICPPDDALIERYKARGDSDQTIERILRVASIYREVESAWWCPSSCVILCKDESEIMHDVLALAKIRAHFCDWHRSYFTDGWGTPLTERAIIVGDRGNPNKKREPWHRPFMTRARENCGGYLFAMLKRAGLTPGMVYIMNAYESDGTPHDRAWLDIKRPAAVVALGENALRWCGDKATHHFPHPQYLYRFWHDFADEYGEQLGEELGSISSVAKK